MAGIGRVEILWNGGRECSVGLGKGSEVEI